jgi:hypothetical protein
MLRLLLLLTALLGLNLGRWALCGEGGPGAVWPGWPRAPRWTVTQPQHRRACGLGRGLGGTGPI